MFEAAEIRRLLDAAAQPLNSMILLGLNAAYGNSDIATLEIGAVDLGAAWINHARRRTGIARRCPLWPETVKAIRDWLAVRPLPKDDADAQLLFTTYKLRSWLDRGQNRALSHEFRKLLDSLGINGHRNFYCLRHTFHTIGDESGDFLAVRRIMGHAGGKVHGQPIFA
jgi:integrase